MIESLPFRMPLFPADLLIGLAMAAFTAAAGGSWAQPAPAADRPEIIAHRGSSSIAPENTLAAVRLAWEQGADAVEVDVHLTRDEQIVCIHDATTERTSDANLTVANVTMAELATLDVGSWKDKRFAGEPIPTLDNVIATIPEGKKLFVEIKAGADGPKVVPHLKKIVEKSGKKDRIVIIGFRYETMEAAHEAMPDVPVKWLLGAPRDEETDELLPIDPAKVTQAREAGFDGLNVSHHGVSRELIEASRDAGMELYIWTLNDMEKAQRLHEMGVAGITTDKPGEMLAYFEGQTGDGQ